MEAAKLAVDEIKVHTGNNGVHASYIDLTDLKSIQSFVLRIDKCHCLINNAGAIFPEQKFINGIEQTMLTNYLGPHLLTNLLLPKIRQTSIDDRAECRIIFISSKLESKGTTEGNYSTWIKVFLQMDTLYNNLNCLYCRLVQENMKSGQLIQTLSCVIFSTPLNYPENCRMRMPT